MDYKYFVISPDGVDIHVFNRNDLTYNEVYKWAENKWPNEKFSIVQDSHLIVKIIDSYLDT